MIIVRVLEFFEYSPNFYFNKEIQNVDSFKIDENDPSNINIENYINKIQLIDNRKIKHINIEHNFTKYTNKINKSSNYSKNKKINNFNNHKNYIQDILNNSNPEQNCNLSLNINNKRILNSNINHVNTNIKKVKSINNLKNMTKAI